ncbi:MAG TPA: NAD(P)-dependent oxidoreductase [Mucilaginibacter sp.]|jgi:nucleoside-diphosphate-sugar epimerase
MKVFVTGATGALGRHVIRNLIDQQIAVAALSRSAQNTELLKKEPVEIRQGDLFNKREMIEAAKDCDAILHLATSIPRKALAKLSDWEMNDRIRAEGTANLIDAAIENDIQTFIGDSVAMLYGQQHGKLVSSGTTLPDDQVEMANSAIQMEKMLVDRLPGKYIIFRFGSYYSADDFYTNGIIDNISKGWMPMLGDGNYYMNWIHLDDAASAIVFGLNNLHALKGKIVNVTDQHPILYADMLNYLSKLLRHKKPFYLPAWLARLFLGKNKFAVLTNSYRVGPEPLLKDWEPEHHDFITGITEIINQKRGKGTK